MPFGTGPRWYLGKAQNQNPSEDLWMHCRMRPPEHRRWWTDEQWLSLSDLQSHPAIVPHKFVTYLQSCVVHIFEWNTRNLLFVSVFAWWYLEEQRGASVCLRKPRTSKCSPSFERDLECSHPELAGFAPSDWIDIYREKDKNNIQLNLPSFLQKALAMRNWHKDGSF
jgi:hypothetical protein